MIEETEPREQTPLQVFEVVFALLASPDLAASRLLLLDAKETVLEAPSGRLLRVVRTPLSAKNIAGVIDYTLTHNPTQGSELVFVGGGQGQARVIEQSVPKLRMSAFFVHHLPDHGKIVTWPARRGHLVQSALEEVRPLTHRQEQELYGRAAFDQARADDEHRERQNFFHQMRSRRAPVTIALLVAIVVMFGLQLAWSHDLLAALGLREASAQWEQYWLVLCVAMGALWAPSVAEGEWWRAISVGFLHFNLLHLAANSFVLFVLGTQLEKLLKSSRLIIIYTVALLGGSAASTLLTRGVAVGASGAIWGLLGAQVALAYGRPPVLPDSIARSMKPMAMRNLILNVGISFIGGIDWAAHFGGGLAGGLLLASGLLYPSERRGTDPRREGKLLRAIATLAVLLLLAGVATALVVGQPWRVAAELG